MQRKTDNQPVRRAGRNPLGPVLSLLRQVHGSSKADREKYMDIINVNILEDGQAFEDCYIRVKGGVIEGFGPMENYTSIGGTVIDGADNYICPGFIDIHNHGARSFDAMDGTREALEAISRYHLEHGVTDFLATTMTGPLSGVEKLCSLLGSGTVKQWAEIIGIHMEGPFVSPKNRGAQPEEYLLKPDAANLKIVEGFKDYVKLITAAPDVENLALLLDFCRKYHITVSGGHDGAVEDEIYEAIEGGMKSVTHLYCCTSSISRRQGPKKHIGLTEIGLFDDRLSAEVIADGHHIPDTLFRLIYKCKGYRKICLVSDGIRASGMDEGRYYLGDSKHGVLVEVKAGIAVLPEDNVYAGSITPINKMVERVVGNCEVPLAYACYMASTAQAELLKLTDKGHIRKGYAAHLNLLDKNGALMGTGIGEDWYEKKI